jgi:hypothetical protein
VVVVDDPQDLNEAKGGSQPPQGRLLVGVDLGHGPDRLPPRWLLAAGPQVQEALAVLELELVPILGRVGRQRLEQVCCVKDGVADAAGWVPGKGTAGLADGSATARNAG